MSEPAPVLALTATPSRGDSSQGPTRRLTRRLTRRPTRHMRLRRTLAWRAAAWLALFALFTAGGAQGLGTQSLTVGSGFADTESALPRLRLELAGLRVGPATVAFGVQGPRPVLTVALTANRAFGPLGNVVFDVRASAASVSLAGSAGGLAAEFAAGARGVIGPVAVRLEAEVFGADPELFSWSAVGADGRPRLGAPGWGLRLGVTGRPSRDLVLEADPEVYFANGPAYRLNALVRSLRTLGDNELRVGTFAYWRPSTGGWSAALVAGVTFPRGRGPAITVDGSLGASPSGWLPGARLALGQRVGAGRLDVVAALEPYREDVAPFRGTASFRLPVPAIASGSELTASVGASSGWTPTGAPSHAARAVLDVSLKVPLQSH